MTNRMLLSPLKPTTVLVMASYFIGSAGAIMAQTAAQGRPETEAVVLGIPGVVAGGTRVQLIRDGFQATEGPVALRDGSVIFTERDANRITKIDPHGNVSTFMENTEGTNSLTIDSKGRLIGVQWLKPQVVVLAPTPQVLADQFDGHPFMRPNDLIVDKKGGVYFSDSGVTPPPGQNMPGPLAIYYIPPGRKILRVAESVPRPNGITLSRDEKVLYAANTAGNSLIAFDVQPDGTLANQRNFGTLEVPPGQNGARNTAAGTDGLAVDAEGRLYAATTLGVQVLSPKGEHLGTILIPKPPQNLAFAGPDKKTLYVVGRGAVYKIQMLTSGYRGRAK